MLPVRERPPAPCHAPLLAVEVRVAAFGLWFAVLSAAMQAEGIFVSTFEELTEGTTVEVEIALPEGSPVQVAGVVANDRERGVGIAIAFDAIDAVDRSARARLERLAPASEMRLRLESVTQG